MTTRETASTGRTERRRSVTRAEQDVRDVSVRHRSNEDGVEDERHDGEQRHHDRATLRHDDLGGGGGRVTGLTAVSVIVALASSAGFGAVSIANRIASPSGPPVAKVRVPPSSKGAPKRCAVA